MNLTRIEDIEKFINKHRFFDERIKYKVKPTNNSNTYAHKYLLMREGRGQSTIYFSYIKVDTFAKTAMFQNLTVVYTIDRDLIINDILK